MNWSDRLDELEKQRKERSTLHNTRERLTRHTNAVEEKISNACGYRTDKRGQKGTAASEFGLCARWSHEFGYVSLHDPTSGEWHDLTQKDAPSWAIREARQRKTLYRAGDHKAYKYTARDMEEMWARERMSKPELGIVEDHPIEEE